MFPKLFEIPSLLGLPPFPIHFYGLFLAIGYLLAIKLGARLAEKQAIDPSRIWDLSVWVLLSAILGSKLLLVVVSPSQAFNLRTAGVFYGGFIAATIVSIWYLRRHQLPILRVCDIAAPAIALGEGIGRIGCLSSGCCWGSPTTSILGITFTSEYAHGVVGVPLYVPLWPTQIILSANGLLLSGLLLFILARRRFEGQVFFSYVLLHSISRGLIEFLRGDMDRGFIGPLSTSQAIAMAAGALAIMALAVLARRPMSTAEATAPRPSGRRRKR